MSNSTSLASHAAPCCAAGVPVRGRPRPQPRPHAGSRRNATAAAQKAIASQPRGHARAATRCARRPTRSTWRAAAAAAGRPRSRRRPHQRPHRQRAIPRRQSLSRSGVALSATQLLWDGLGIRSDIERLGHEQPGALLRVARRHRDDRARGGARPPRRACATAAWCAGRRQLRAAPYAITQIQPRLRAGVGRGVDLEQAKARAWRWPSPT